MPRIDAVIISDGVLDKLGWKHNVTFEEVEDACYAEPPTLHLRRGKENSMLVFSRTRAGRYLLVVLSYLGDNTWRVRTAREMTANEKRMYQASGGR